MRHCETMLFVFTRSVAEFFCGAFRATTVALAPLRTKTNSRQHCVVSLSKADVRVTNRPTGSSVSVCHSDATLVDCLSLSSWCCRACFFHSRAWHHTPASSSHATYQHNVARAPLIMWVGWDPCTGRWFRGIWCLCWRICRGRRLHGFITQQLVISHAKNTWINIIGVICYVRLNIWNVNTLRKNGNIWFNATSKPE